MTWYCEDLRAKFRQTSGTFTESWTVLKRKFEFTKGTTYIQCEEQKNCQDCHQIYVDDELLQYIYIGIREQTIMRPDRPGSR